MPPQSGELYESKTISVLVPEEVARLARAPAWLDTNLSIPYLGILGTLGTVHKSIWPS